MNPCLTCGFLAPMPRGNRRTMMCGKAGDSAHAERANPNGCGPDGKWWAAKGASAATAGNAALTQAMAALAEAQQAVAAAMAGKAPAGS